MAFGTALRKSGLVQSVGRPASCWDNIVAESFFATLKEELIYRHTWPHRGRAQLAIFEYIEIFYNRERRHTTLGNLSPADYVVTASDQPQYRQVFRSLRPPRAVTLWNICARFGRAQVSPDYGRSSLKVELRRQRLDLTAHHAARIH
jgi:hypothetical protein